MTIQKTDHWSKDIGRIFLGSVSYSEICNCCIHTSNYIGNNLFSKRGNQALSHLLWALFNVCGNESVQFGIYLRNSGQPLIFRKHLEAVLSSTGATLLSSIKSMMHTPVFIARPNVSSSENNRWPFSVCITYSVCRRAIVCLDSCTSAVVLENSHHSPLPAWSLLPTGST